MTLIIDHRSPSRTHRALIWLEAQLSRASEAVARHRREYASRRTAREIASLPFDVRKDIGWPARNTTARELH
ncbi:hypothetical protein [Affinirhizobium pseudoryzae]|jgi:hypothetical protein|uniref:hypothetical protein n=1 Tax=Allorhizobium pseudoryzae TaxID=379684 RepID=UPI0013EB27BF|nr:hypothetical protein [Allorhizobium pseudoryzae]